MGSPVKKRMRVLETKQDRISRLPDELIHKVLSFVDAKVALQTSVLSKRWKLVWTTLPFLNIGEYQHSSPQNTYGFIRHVLSNRNHQSRISQLKLCSSESKPPDSLVEKFVEYAIQHNVQDLSLRLLYRHDSFNLLSTLCSNSLKKLTLHVKVVDFASESDCWNLPALTYLCLVRPYFRFKGSFSDVCYKLPKSCLTCLPALKSLCLEDWNLLISSFSFGLPDLTTLRLSRCTDLPRGIWNFPALSSLELDRVDFRENMSAIFPTLVHLQNLTLSLTRSNMEQHHLVSSPQLLNLIIKVDSSDSLYGNIKVLAPKLRNFSSVGILSITLDVPKLENVHIELIGWIGNEDWIYRKKIYRLFTDMLSGLGNAKNLMFDFNSIQALSVADFLASLTSPFYNLEIVKLPPRYKESSMSGALRTYLLGGSPKATIVTTLYKNNVTQPVSLTSQKAMLDGPFAIPTNVNSVVDANRMRQIGAPVAGTSNDRASSSRGDADFGLWHGHEVNLEFVGLLDLIMKNYPQTFEHFTAKSKRFHTFMLNMLCTSVNEFLGTSMTEVSTDIVTECRNLFADLQRWGFNVVWLVSHLNYVEQVLVSQHEHHAIESRTDDAKNKLQELQTYCLEKITAMHKASASP